MISTRPFSDFVIDLLGWSVRRNLEVAHELTASGLHGAGTDDSLKEASAKAWRSSSALPGDPKPPVEQFEEMLISGLAEPCSARKPKRKPRKCCESRKFTAEFKFRARSCKVSKIFSGNGVGHVRAKKSVVKKGDLANNRKPQS